MGGKGTRNSLILTHTILAQLEAQAICDDGISQK